MISTPAGIPEAVWLTWRPGARQFILAQQRGIHQLCSQLTALAIELASLRERIGRSSPNSSKPPSSGSVPRWSGPCRRPWRFARQQPVAYVVDEVKIRLLTVSTILRQQGRDVWQFLKQALIAHHRGGVMPSLLSDP